MTKPHEPTYIYFTILGSIFLSTGLSLILEDIIDKNITATFLMVGGIIAIVYGIKKMDW